jgi:hypothetical protein
MHEVLEKLVRLWTVVKPDAATWPAWVQAIAAAIICGYTVKLTWLTERYAKAADDAAKAASISAEAATKSLEAAEKAAIENKRSTDLIATLNRPYMGVHRVAFPNPAGQNEMAWGISSEIRNFGTLPALSVDARVEFVLNETVLYAAAGPFAAEIFPQSEPVTIDAHFQFTGPRRDEVLSGAVDLTARIQILYAASNGQRYKHRANALFRRGYPVFSVIDSETTQV